MRRPSSTWRTIRRISSTGRRSHHRTASTSIHGRPSRRTARAWSVGISRRRASRGKVPVVVLLSIALIIIPAVVSLAILILVLVVLLVVLLWSRRRSELALRRRP